MLGRVGGYLGVGRAIGDKSVPGITARPKITTYTLPPPKPGESRHLILTCDGIPDVCSNRQIAKAVFNQKGTPKELAEKLVTAAFRAGSADNLSAMVIQLPTVPGPITAKK